MPCPCGLPDKYESCCGRYHSGETSAPTAEKLMRSRYCAFAKQNVAYLKETTWPSNQKHFDEVSYYHRAASSIWLGLTLHETEAGLEADMRGTVTFTAKSMINGTIDEQTEKSVFRKKGGKWFYVKAI